MPTGHWDTLEWKHVKENQHDREGENRWYVCDDSGENFTGFHVKINVSEFSAWRKTWYDLRAEKNLDFGFYFRNLTVNDHFGVNIVLNFKRCEESWGFFHDYWVFAGSNINATYKNEYGTIGGDVWNITEAMKQDKLELFPSYVEVFVWRNENDFCIKILNYRWDQPKPDLLYEKNYTMPASWFDNVAIGFWVRHWGSGSFEAGWTEPDVYHNTPYNPSIPETQDVWQYTIWDFINELKGFAGKIIPDWMQGWITQLGSWSASFFAVLAMVWGSVTQFVPILPMILLFWILDATITSVTEGDLHPIGNCFMTLYNTARGIIQAIVSIIHTIYDFIHFW